MDAVTQRAVLAAARRTAEGRPVSISDRAFWREHGLPDVSVRQDVIARAAALEQGSASAILNDWQGTVGSVFGGTGFPAGDGDRGPADTGQARVFVRFSFEDARGNIVYRSFANTYDWGEDLEDVLDDLNDAISDMEGGYGLSNGQLVAESLIIY